MTRIEAMIAGVPFAAKVGAQDLRELLRSWTMQESTAPSDGRVIERRVWTDCGSGLQVAMHLRRFNKFPAVDWFVELTNTGQSDTPILEQVQALDATLEVAAQRVDLLYANGSLCQMDDFLPQQTELGPWYDHTFAPVGGRSSNGILPFMNLKLAGGGLVIGIG